MFEFVFSYSDALGDLFYLMSLCRLQALARVLRAKFLARDVQFQRKWTQTVWVYPLRAATAR